MAICPSCKTDSPDVYLGLYSIECPNLGCKNYSPKCINQKNKEGLKVWVWEDVLFGENGVVVIVAPDEKTAWDILREKNYEAFDIIRGTLRDQQGNFIEDNRLPEELPKDVVRPRIIEDLEVIIHWEDR